MHILKNSITHDAGNGAILPSHIVLEFRTRLALVPQVWKTRMLLLTPTERFTTYSFSYNNPRNALLLSYFHQNYNNNLFYMMLMYVLFPSPLGDIWNSVASQTLQYLL